MATRRPSSSPITRLVSANPSGRLTISPFAARTVGKLPTRNSYSPRRTNWKSLSGGTLSSSVPGASHTSATSLRPSWNRLARHGPGPRRARMSSARNSVGSVGLTIEVTDASRRGIGRRRLYSPSAAPLLNQGYQDKQNSLDHVVTKNGVVGQTLGTLRPLRVRILFRGLPRAP